METIGRVVLLASLWCGAGCHAPTAASECRRITASTTLPAPDLSTPESACRSIVNAFNQRLADCGIDDADDSQRVCAGLNMLASPSDITYDADAAAAAIAEIANATDCDLLPIVGGNDLEARVRTALKGTLGANQSCFSSFECDHGSCFTMFGCPGNCQPFGTATLGASCALGGAQCDQGQGLYCNLSTATCVTPPGEGEPCANLGTDRLEDVQCAPQLICGGDNICHARARAGQACTGTIGDPRVAECAQCASCIDGLCHLNLRPNAACGSDDECMPGLICDGGSCQPSLAKLGDACGSLVGRTRYVACDPTVGFCNYQGGGGCAPYGGCGVCIAPPPAPPRCF